MSTPTDTTNPDTDKPDTKNLDAENLDVEHLGVLDTGERGPVPVFALIRFVSLLVLIASIGAISAGGTRLATTVPGAWLARILEPLASVLAN